MRVKIILGTFIGVASSWALVVLVTAINNGHDPIHAALYALVGAALIAAVGLRLAHIVDLKLFIRQCNSAVKYQVVNPVNALESYQMGHRQPYISHR